MRLIYQRFSDVFAEDAPVVVLSNKVIPQSLPQAVGGSVGADPHDAGKTVIRLTLFKDDIDAVAEWDRGNFFPGVSRQLRHHLMQAHTQRTAIVKFIFADRRIPSAQPRQLLFQEGEPRADKIRLI